MHGAFNVTSEQPNYFSCVPNNQYPFYIVTTKYISGTRKNNLKRPSINVSVIYKKEKYQFYTITTKLILVLAEYFHRNWLVSIKVNYFVKGIFVTFYDPYKCKKN